MKNIIAIIFSALSCLCFAQTINSDWKTIDADKPLNRILYEQYFKSLYHYEPSIIRENNIAYLEVKSNRKIGDSLVFSRINQKASFREDGRPIHVVEWNEYPQDSMFKDYSYDSLGNLIEYRYWFPKEGIYGKKEIGEISHLIFHYTDNLLTKVFGYSNSNGSNNSTLYLYDTLSYNLIEQKVSIFHGNANKIIHYAFNEKESINKSTDKESIWETDCVYYNPALNELQRLTGKQCFNRDIINLFNGVSLGPLGFEPITKIQAMTFDTLNFFKDNNAVFVDTLNQKIYIKQNFTTMQPTSLEDRITNTQSIQTYDYLLRLIQTESVRESSRGQREYSKDSSQTFYTYFNFGILQRKLEFHYIKTKYHTNLHITTSGKPELGEKEYFEFINEEETTIKTWK